MADSDSKYKIITGDCNAKLELKQKKKAQKHGNFWNGEEKRERTSVNRIYRGI